MKTQNLIRYVIAAWLKKHSTGGFYLTYRPSKDSEGKQTLFLTSNTKDAKLTIYDGIFHNDTTELRTEMAIAKALNIETARGSLADKWDILALERLYQQLYKVIMTVDNYLTSGEVNVYTSEQYPNSYDEARVKDTIRKIVERKSPFTN